MVKALDKFSIMTEHQTGKKLKKIRCDNEFDCELWRKWAAEQGVIIKLIPLYSSAANGMAEQALRIIFRMVRIMLVKAKMSHDWWAEACDYVIKAGNLLPSSWHLGKVPEEGWTGNSRRLDTFICGDQYAMRRFLQRNDTANCLHKVKRAD